MRDVALTRDEVVGLMAWVADIRGSRADRHDPAARLAGRERGRPGSPVRVGAAAELPGVVVVMEMRVRVGLLPAQSSRSPAAIMWLHSPSWMLIGCGAMAYDVMIEPPPLAGLY